MTMAFISRSDEFTLSKHQELKAYKSCSDDDPGLAFLHTGQIGFPMLA